MSRALSFFSLAAFVLVTACSRPDHVAPQSPSQDRVVDTPDPAGAIEALDAGGCADVGHANDTGLSVADSAAEAGVEVSSDAEVPPDASAPDAGSLDAAPADSGTVEALIIPPGTRWQWQLSGDLDMSVDVPVYDIDLHDVSVAEIRQLTVEGRRVICYFSAGTMEEWRADANRFRSRDLGEEMGDWPGETWVDTRSSRVRDVMRDRITLAALKGCFGVEPDNVDGYQNDTGFNLTRATQLDYNRFLAAEAHARGLSVGLKNAVELVDELEPDFDWALNESCVRWSECPVLQRFITAGKAVFHTEYVSERRDGPALRRRLCGRNDLQGFSTLIKTRGLDAWFDACP